MFLLQLIMTPSLDILHTFLVVFSFEVVMGMSFFTSGLQRCLKITLQSKNKKNVTSLLFQMFKCLSVSQNSVIAISVQHWDIALVCSQQ